MSNTVDWSKAPEGAEFYAFGNFRKKNGMRSDYFKDGYWHAGYTYENCLDAPDYQPRPSPQEKPMKYEYGVEYQTNGVKPDLPDDVLVEVKLNNEFFKNEWVAGDRIAGVTNWSSKITAFRIVDKRYKPAVTPVEQTNKYDRTITGKYGTGKCTIDVYRVLAAYDVTDSEVAHAVKKLLAPGQRGVKEERQDIEEAIQSLQAWIARMDDEGVK